MRIISFADAPPPLEETGGAQVKDISGSGNLLDTNYFELLSAAPGNSGLSVGLPGAARTVGITMRMNVRSADCGSWHACFSVDDKA